MKIEESNLLVQNPSRKELPETSFLKLYLQYTQNHEAPELFHLWVAFTLMSSVMGRKCFINKGYYKLYPNLFTILVAGAARCRKSTAIDIGINLLQGIHKDSLKIIAGKIIPEKFTRDISNAKRLSPTSTPNDPKYLAPSILVHADELSVFLSRQQHSEPLIHLLTTLFNCPNKWEYKTKNKGEDTLYDVFISILAGATPDTFASSIPVSAIKDGFITRTIIVFQADTDRENALPELTDEEILLEKTLQKYLVALSEVSGEFQLSPDATVWYRKWYSGYMKEPAPDLRLEGIHARKHDHLLRVAMILAAASFRKVLEIGDLEAALMALNQVQALSGGAFMELGGDDTTHHMARALGFLKRYKRISHSELLKKMYPCDAYKFRNIMQTILESNHAIIDPTNDKVYIYQEEPPPKS